MRRKSILRLWSWLIIISLLVNAPVVSEAKAKPKLNKTKLTLALGETANLVLKNKKGKVKWSSSKKSVASVTSYGEVKAKKAGQAKITAKMGKKKYTCRVNVPRQYISNTLMAMDIGEKRQLRMYGVSGSDEVFWASDDEKVATVTASGRVTAKRAGETTVYAAINNGNGKTYECNLIVGGGGGTDGFCAAYADPLCKCHAGE